MLLPVSIDDLNSGSSMSAIVKSLAESANMPHLNLFAPLPSSISIPLVSLSRRLNDTKFIRLSSL